MKRNPLYRLILTTAALLFLAACDGGTGGTGADGASLGVMTKGSVIVNGTRFTVTSGTAITIDDAAGTEAGLKNGMVVKVNGTFDSAGATGTAAAVVFADNVEGPVSGITPIDATNTRQFTVLGQTVIADSQTVFEGTTLAGLVDGNVVEVSGLTDTLDRIRASRVEFKAASFTPGMPIEVKGVIQNLDNVAKTFRIKALTVNYASANLTNLPGGTPANGLFVEVKGSSFGAGGELIATHVELEPRGLGLNDAEQAEVEGFVTGFIDLNSAFTVNGQTVKITSSTRFEGGLASEIANGVKLEAEGPIVAGILVAEKIKFRDNIKLEGDVATISGSNLTVKGMPSITVTTNSLTEFKGGVTSLAQILVNDHVRVRGRQGSGNTVIATEVEKRSAATDAVLQGPVANIVAPNSFTILGVNVDTTGFLDPQFIGLNDVPIGRAAFFASLQTGDLVKAQGTLNSLGNAVDWDEVELED